MRERQPSFTVEVRRASPAAPAGGRIRDAAAYHSQAGDARRSGRAARGLMPVHVAFVEHAHEIVARLGVVTVGAITHDVTCKGFFWAVCLPGLPRAPRPAKDADAARRAVAHKVREWCEAARLISVRGD